MSVVARQNRTSKRLPNHGKLVAGGLGCPRRLGRAFLTGGWRILPGHEERVGKASGRGKAQESERQKNDLAGSEGVDTNQNHTDCCYYKHRTCQLNHRKGRLARRTWGPEPNSGTGRQPPPIPKLSARLLTYQRLRKGEILFCLSKVRLDPQGRFVVSDRRLVLSVSAKNIPQLLVGNL